MFEVTHQNDDQLEQSTHRHPAEKHLDNTLFVKMSFKFVSVSSYVGQGWCMRKQYVKFYFGDIKKSKCSNLGGLEI